MACIDKSREIEEYNVQLSDVTVLELVIVPDISRGAARRSPHFMPTRLTVAVYVDQHAPNYDQLDERAVWFYEAVAVSKGMLTQTPGVGQRYIASYKDRDGHWLRPEKGHVRADG